MVMVKVFWTRLTGLLSMRVFQRAVTTAAFLAVLLLMRRFAKNLNTGVKPKRRQHLKPN